MQQPGNQKLIQISLDSRVQSIWAVIRCLSGCALAGSSIGSRNGMWTQVFLCGMSVFQALSGLLCWTVPHSCHMGVFIQLYRPRLLPWVQELHNLGCLYFLKSSGEPCGPKCWPSAFFFSVSIQSGVSLRGALVLFILKHLLNSVPLVFCRKRQGCFE